MAKGNSKYFLWNEVIANIYFLILNIAGYYFYGLNGLGISFLIGYFLHFIQTFLFTSIKYNFKFTNENIVNVVICISAGIVCFLVNYFLSELHNYIFGSLLIGLISFYSLYKINKKTEFLKSLKMRSK